MCCIIYTWGGFDVGGAGGDNVGWCWLMGYGWVMGAIGCVGVCVCYGGSSNSSRSRSSVQLY